MLSIVIYYWGNCPNCLPEAHCTVQTSCLYFVPINYLLFILLLILGIHFKKNLLKKKYIYQRIFYTYNIY